MYYDIYINEKKVATVGPWDLEFLSVSLSSSSREDQPFISANGMTKKGDDGAQFYFTWLEEHIQPTDRVQVIPSSNSEASEPKKTDSAIFANRKSLLLVGLFSQGILLLFVKNVLSSV